MVLRFVLSALILYLCLYPAWRWASPSYIAGVARVYAAAAPLVEHPQTTRAVVVRGDELVVRTTGRMSYAIENKNLYIDLPLLVALALCSPGVSWGSRLRIALLGYVPLGLSHCLALGLNLQVAHARQALASGTEPGFLVNNVALPITRLAHSDLGFVAPFLIWGVLYLFERTRRGENRRSFRKKRR